MYIYMKNLCIYIFTYTGICIYIYIYTYIYIWPFRTKKRHAAIHLCGGNPCGPLAGAGVPSVFFGGGWALSGWGPLGYVAKP